MAVVDTHGEAIQIHMENPCRYSRGIPVDIHGVSLSVLTGNPLVMGTSMSKRTMRARKQEAARMGWL